jgi:hypothetical protein
MIIVHCHCGENAFPRGKGLGAKYIHAMMKYVIQCPDCKCTVYGRDQAELEVAWYAKQEEMGHEIEIHRRQNKAVG